MEITELLPTPFVLPAGEAVQILTQRWALEPWEGEDLPGLAMPWARKPKFSVREAGHVRSWPLLITCGPMAGTASG
jgi:hypothetical protein